MPAHSPPPIPADARRSLRLYNLFFPFVFLLLLPGFLLRLRRRGNFRDGFGQRLGRYSANFRHRLSQARPIWIHSISVGETLGALKLARQLHSSDPQTRIVLSATTSTGLALIREAAAEWLEPIYNPVDFLPIIRRALDTLRPAQIIFIEGEAWPNLLAESRRRGIPATLVNARLSPRSERRFGRFRALTGPLFRLLDLIAVPEPNDIPRWESLGVARDRLRVTGNLKFDYALPTATREAEFRALAAPLGVNDSTPVIVAGSTFDGEEKILASLLVELRRKYPRLVLILVPRHVERTAAVLRDLAPFNLRIAQRSVLPFSAPNPCDILLVDTTGELRDWYHLATVVFIGKSLTAEGGQNPAEAIILGKPVLFGPHMENFATLTSHLLAQDAAIQVPTATALSTTLDTLLADEPRRIALGARAREALTDHQGATERTAALLHPAGAAP